MGPASHMVDAEMASLTSVDQAALVSWALTQKKAPPLQVCVLCSCVMTEAACPPLALEPVPEQSDICGIIKIHNCDK